MKGGNKLIDDEITLDKATYKNRWVILCVLITLPFMSNLDVSIINIALPTLRKSLDINMFKSSWIVSSYLISISAFIIIFGKLGDSIGKEKVFLRGLIVFTAGSFFCGISPSITILILSRIIQGIGASMLMANNQGIIVQIFPEKERGIALGVSSACVAVGAIFGPPIGGFIITYLSWHYIFLINVPLGLIAIVVGYKTLPSSKIKKVDTFNKLNVFLLSASIVFFFLGLLISQNLGLSNIIVLTFMIGGILLFLLFVYVELNSNDPLIDFTIFKNQSFSICLICAFTFAFVTNSINIMLPFYLADALKLSPSIMSLILLISPTLMFITSPLAGNISGKVGIKRVTIFGLSLLLITLFFMQFLGLKSSIIYLIILLILFGISSGSFHCTNTNLIMSYAPKEKLGIAGSCNALIRNLGYTCGTSISTSIFYFAMSSKVGYKVIDSALESGDTFVYGMRIVFIVIIIMTVISLSLSLLNYCKSK